jgi:tetratricopeptide (TPR) repeat protein
VDTQTRHALKQDKFVTATTSGLEWIGENRSSLVLWGIGAVVAVGLLIAGIVVYHNRSTAADQLLGQALTIYETPIAQPGEPTEPGMTTYPSAAARAKAAYPLFHQAAEQYSWLSAGHKALYFAGMTQIDMGQTVAGEADLQKAASKGGKNLASLAKLALANEYAQTGKTMDAEALFKELIQHPTTTVPKAAAQLQLAGIYEATQPDQAKKIYAQIVDQDKGTDAAQIAQKKLASLK